MSGSLHKNSSNAILLILLALPALAHAQSHVWTHFGQSPDRIAAINTSNSVHPIDLSRVAWQTTLGPSGESISISNATAPVIDNTRLYALASLDGQPSLIAFDLVTGSALWSAPAPAPVNDSWSSPAIDTVNNSVIIAARFELWAFDAADGTPLWTTTLDRAVVNACPLVTSDLGPADRALIVHEDSVFSTFDGGRLYCVNVDPFDAAVNPFQPGDIVWSVALNAATTGTTVAYDDGIVYLADAGDPFFGSPGSIHAYNVAALSAPPPLWITTNPINVGFYSGVSVSESASGKAVFAASYNFSGGQFSSNLIKLDASTGAVLWSVPCNRTNSIPILLPGNRILLSTGIDGFGSLPSLELFQDNGISAALLWDTAIDTWIDTNNNSVMDIGEFLLIGGWTHLPAVANTPSGSIAYVGSLPIGNLFAAYAEIRAIDLSLNPADPGFVVQTRLGAGASPAITSTQVFTLGPAGPIALGMAQPNFDVNNDGREDIDDLYDWFSGAGSPNINLDVNNDGSTTFDDKELLEQHLRMNELQTMTAAR